MNDTREQLSIDMQIDDVTSILGDLIDPSDCWYDHHGYCQAHDWLEEGECPHARGKKWLANFERQKIKK